MNLAADVKICTGRFSDVALLSAREILSPEEIQSMLDDEMSKSGLENISAWTAALEARFGRLSGQGAAHRIGRSFFKYGLQRWGDQIGLTGTPFRLLPPAQRLRSGLVQWAGLFSDQTGAVVTVGEEEQDWTWQLKSCPVCWERQSDWPTCGWINGLLQELAAWADTSRYHSVRERECMAMGAACCTFAISKKAIE